MPVGPRVFAWLLPAVVCLIGASFVVADVVAITGKAPMINVEIIALRDGRLHYRSAGRDAAQDLGQVEYLQVSGWELFNLAEQQQRKKDWRSAISGYEKALVEFEMGAGNAASSGPKAQGLDRDLLLKCRLVRAHETQGRFERAVELFIQVVERDLSLLEPVRPTRLPPESSPELDVALLRLDEAVRRHPGDAVGAALTRWRATWPAVKPKPAGPGESPVAPPTPPKSGVDETLRQELAQVRRLIESGGFDEALERLDKVPAESAGPLRPDLFYWRGRAWSGKGEAAADQATAQSDRRRAGLAFMRVVVHFPRDPLALECLFRTADLCRRDGLGPQARRLWSELMVLGAGTLWAEQARGELDKTPVAANSAAGGSQ